MTKVFRTIGACTESEIIINKSRFIGRAFPLKNEDEAYMFLEDIRKEFPDASHHCYAYVLGRSSNIQRFNDDGEPGGTAGMPILQVILQQELEDVLVIVTRYFGGIKLGAGGLVRAYSKTAADLLQKADKVHMTMSHEGYLSVDYGIWGTLEYFLRQQDISILDTDYKENIRVKVITPMAWDKFSNMITDVTNGRASLKYKGQRYYSWD